MADSQLGPKAPAAASHSGAITANLLEEERAAFVVNNDQEMLEANAAHEAEAESREKLETLQWQLKHKRSSMKMLQECTPPTLRPIPSLTNPSTVAHALLGIVSCRLLSCACLAPRRVSASHLATSSGDCRRRVHGTHQPAAHD